MLLVDSLNAVFTSTKRTKKIYAIMSDRLNEIILKQSHSVFFLFEYRDSHLTFERDKEKAIFFSLSITHAYSRMDIETKKRLIDDRTEEGEKKTIEGNTFERGQNTEQLYKVESV